MFEELANAATTCQPHIWEIPEVGDDWLTCKECDRRLHFFHDITQDMRAAILGGYSNRRGPELGHDFRVAYLAAAEDCSRRNGAYHGQTTAGNMTTLPKRERPRASDLIPSTVEVSQGPLPKTSRRRYGQ